MPAECSSFLQNHFGSAYTQLERNAQISLGTAYLENGVSNTRLQTILGLHSTDVGKLLSHLVDQNMLVVNSRGRWTTYSINNEFVPAPDQTTFNIFETAYDKLNETDRMIYDYIRANGFITAKKVVEITRITTQQGASIALGRLIERGLVKSVQRGRSFIYELT